VTTTTLEKRLLRMTHRTYLWLYLVIEELGTSLRRNVKGIMDVVDNLPETVEEAYEMILSKSSKNSRQRCNARTLLHIIVAVRRPLLLKELEVAFQIATQEHDDSYSKLAIDGNGLAVRIRNLCGLFVFINDKRVYLIHQTAKEFLVAKSQSMHVKSCWNHSLKKEDSEMVMAKACTQYLLFADFNDISAVDGDDFSKPTSYERPEFGFMDYSALNWTSHFREAKLDKTHSVVQDGLMLCNTESSYVRIWFSRYWRYYRSWDDMQRPRIHSTYQVAAMCGLIW
jgi:ankyrin repeat domain-containing protein 50